MAFLPLASALVAVFVACFAYYVRELVMNRKRSNLHLLAYPSSPHWLWGHEKEILYNTAYGKLYSKWFNEEEGALRIKGALWFGDILVVADPQALFHIGAKNIYNYRRTLVFRSLIERSLGRSVVWAEGDEHKRMRSVLNSCFTAQKVKEMQDVVQQCAENLVSAMRGYVNSQIETGTTSPVVNISEWNSSVALDVIGRVGFRHDFGLGKSPEAQEIFRSVEDAFESMAGFSGLLISSILRAFPLIALLPSEEIRRQESLRNFVRKVGKQIAEEKIAHLASGESLADENKDLLSYLIKVSYKEGQSLNVDELLDHITTFILSGYETTATTLSFAIHSLAHHSDIQTQLRTELLEFGREPTFDDLHNKDDLRVLDAVTKETLRLFPAGAQAERVAAEDDIIPLRTPVHASDGTLLNSITIRKGQMVVIPRLSVNTRLGVWGPDGEMFRPSRWLEQDTADEKTTSKLPQVSLSGWNHLDSFGEGTRMCLGYRLAVFEVKAVLASLVKAFVFEEVPGVAIKNRSIATSLVPTTMQNVPGTTQAHMKVHYLPVKVSLVAQH